jgi:hypothetical protein
VTAGESSERQHGSRNPPNGEISPGWFFPLWEPWRDTRSSRTWLKYYDPDFECFSAWRPDELRAFSDFNRKLGLLSWQRIYETGGKRKTGLGFTQHDENARVPRLDFLDQLDPDIRLFELRVTLKARVHGFRAGDAFFLVLLDREHRV